MYFALGLGLGHSSAYTTQNDGECKLKPIKDQNQSLTSFGCGTGFVTLTWR